MRDFEIYGNDLIVATHGRGFWVIDDISPLRQINDDGRAAPTRICSSRPTRSTSMQGGDNGTPMQKDEPQARIRRTARTIDYYLKANATSVTIEVLNAGGSVVGAPPGGGGRGAGGGGGGGAFPPNTTILWRAAAEPMPTSAGHHRVVLPLGGGGRGGRGGGGGPVTGAFTVRLTVDGQTYTQPLTVKPDPRR